MQSSLPQHSRPAHAGGVPPSAGGPRIRPPPAGRAKPAKPPPPSLPPSLIVVDPPGHRSGYVAIVGKPNAGKSTLLNALLGQRLAIVTAKAQTTRHRILGILSAPDHQALLVDTPGVMSRTRNQLDSAMMRTVRTAVTQADVICVVVDAAAAASARDPAEGMEGLSLTGEEGGAPLCVLLNKTDLLQPDQIDALRVYYASRPGVAAALCASAATGEGVPQLRDWLVSSLPLGQSLYPKDIVSEHPERFFVAEFIRERIFEQYRQEIPYATTVAVLDHREGRGGAKDVIRVEICCERDSQKAILVGAGGAAIKQLSTAARLSIEAFLERPVYLEMRVKTAAGWRDDKRGVDAGYVNASQLK